MLVCAKHKSARISPLKLRLIVDAIRGKMVEDALEILSFNNRKGAVLVKKLLESAVANAENNEGIDIDELKIEKVFVDEAATMKRMNPRAKGRADRIFKRSSHVTVYLSNN